MSRDIIHDAACKNHDKIQAWFQEKTKQLEYPIYSSYDIRDASYKISNVDANIYPAGFNNICPTDKEAAPEIFKKYIQVHYGTGIKKILLITEEHTKNPYYMENVATIQDLLQQADFEVALAFPKELAEPITLQSSTGKILTFESGYENSAFFKSYNPDLVISNNDFSLSLAEWSDQNSRPTNPPRELGWYQRQKSRYFKHYNDLVNQFSEVAGIDPFLLRVETEEFLNFNINDETSRNELADQVQKFLDKLAVSYKERGINQKPFCFVKNNAGTYGLAVIKVSSAEEIKEWTYNSRKKMKAAKGGRDVEEVIIQEGIPSIVTSDSASAEPVINSASPVSVAFPTDTLSLDNAVSISATATYLLKSDVKANATG
ncbi:MAG: glutamate--cysteine ligase, partial [Bdellovibrionaceae bacterium]|nr:glutamate--cysteine ligase [Pseudobdellovibrionaceae bacterium]